MITVCDQLEAMTGIADALEEVANAMAQSLNLLAPDGETLYPSDDALVCDLSSAKEQVLDEIGVLRALVTDLRHQEDTINTQRLRIQDLARLKKIHGVALDSHGGGERPGCTALIPQAMHTCRVVD